MKFYIKLALMVLVFVGAATMFEVDIPVMYDIKFLSPIWMAIMDMAIRTVSTLVALVPAVIFGFFWGFILILLAGMGGHDATEDETAGLVVVLILLFLTPIMIFVHPYIMTSWIFSNSEWAIQFSYWQYAVTSFIVLVVSFGGVDIKSSVLSATAKVKETKK